MACHYIPYTIQKFDIYMRFPWLMTHGMPLHFLYYSEIWYLNEISLVNDTWHAVTFPILFRNLNEISLVNNTWHAFTFPILFRNVTFTWDFHGQQHMKCCYISYTIQKFDIYMRSLWSTTHGMLLHFLYYSKNLTFNNAWHAITFPILFRNLTFKWDSFG